MSLVNRNGWTAYALALAIRLLDRIESLEAELAALRLQASRRFQERA